MESFPSKMGSLSSFSVFASLFEPCSLNIRMSFRGVFQFLFVADVAPTHLSSDRPSTASILPVCMVAMESGECSGGEVPFLAPDVMLKC